MRRWCEGEVFCFCDGILLRGREDRSGLLVWVGKVLFDLGSEL